MSNPEIPMFTGTIDELLDHSMTLDVDKIEAKIEADIYNEENRLFVKDIMEDLECSEEEATKIYNEVKLEEVTSVVDELVLDGVLEIVGYDDNGEPLFGIKGKKYPKK